MKRSTVLLLAALIGVAGATHAADPVSSKPTAKTGHAAKPSVRGPGTQTEDELFIGAKAKTPQKASAKPSARARTGDEDLEDLEIQRQRPKPSAK